MPAILDLQQLLKTMKPELQKGEFAFCTTEKSYDEFAHLNPLASFREAEGLTLVLETQQADNAQLSYEGVFSQITLTVHSSLEAVGLTAAVANKLSQSGISANVVAAYYHDHLFVQRKHAEKALAALRELSAEQQ